MGAGSESLFILMCVYVHCTQSSATSCHGLLLLQVAVHFEAVVAGVSDNNVSVRSEGQSLWAVQRVGGCVDVGQERAAAIEHLTKRLTITVNIYAKIHIIQ